MKTAILAGGMGSRLSEETVARPKPMVEVGGRPILWHIMKIYAHQGHRDFVVALGYRGECIKRYFADYASLTGDLMIDIGAGTVERNEEAIEGWRIQLVETGLHTNTGGRIKRLAQSIDNERFFLTWGDGVADIDLEALLAFHKSHGRIATVTAVRPPARFGKLGLDGDVVRTFSEKPQLEEGWINGAFFVLEPAIFDYIAGDDTLFEREPLEALAADGQLMAYRHESFWQCMDTVRDRYLLERLWENGAPWKLWDQHS